MRSYAIPKVLKRSEGSVIYKFDVELGSFQASMVSMRGVRGAKEEAERFFRKEFGLEHNGYPVRVRIANVAEVWDSREIHRLDMDCEWDVGLSPRQYIHYARLDQAKLDRRRQR